MTTTKAALKYSTTPVLLIEGINLATCRSAEYWFLSKQRESVSYISAALGVAAPRGTFDVVWSRF